MKSDERAGSAAMKSGHLCDSTLLVGFFAAQFGNEYELYRDVIHPALHDYRAKLNRTMTQFLPPPAPTLSEAYYAPHGYFMFGRLPVGMICLIDDYEITWSLLAAHAISNLQLTYGPTPRIEGQDSLEAAFSSFMKPTTRPPLVGIARLKINSNLLLAFGAGMLNAAIAAIHSLAADFQAAGPAFQVLITQSYGWNELTVIMLSDGFNKIARFVQELCHYTLGGLQRRSAELGFALAGRTLWSMIAADLSGPEQAGSDDGSHIFSLSLTTTGIEIESLAPGASPAALLDRIDPADRVVPMINCTAHSGHLRTIFELLGAAAGGKEAVEAPIIFGSADFLCTADRQLPHEQSTRDFLQDFFRFRALTSLQPHLWEVNTEIATFIPMRGEAAISPLHPSMAELIKGLAYSHDELLEIANACLRLQLPHQLRVQVENMFAIAATCIQDRLLFESCFELEAFLRHLKDTLVSLAQSPLPAGAGRSKFYESLTECVAMFSKAFTNRYYGHVRLSHDIDMNLEYKGSNNQIITVVDAIALEFTSAVSSCLKPGFMVVSGTSHVTYRFNSLGDFIVLNLLHLYAPEEVVVLAHEIGHRLFFCDDYYDVRSALPIRPVRDSYFLSNLVLEDVFADIYAFYFIHLGNPELYEFFSAYNYYSSSMSSGGDNSANRSLEYYFTIRKDLVLQSCAPDYEPWSITKQIRAANEPIHDFYGDWCRLVQDRFRQLLLQTNNADSLEELAARRRAELAAIRGCLERGAIYPYFPEQHRSPLNFIQLLLYEYQIILHEELMKGEAIKPELGEDGDPLPSGGYSPMLADPRGGTFVIEPKLRRKYFTARNTLLQSLYDMACKKKGKAIAARIKERFSSRA